MATGGKKETGSNLRSIGTLKLKPDDLDPSGVVVVGDKLVITVVKSKKVHVYRRHDGMLMSSSDELESTPLGLCRVNDTDLCVVMMDGMITLMSVQDSGLISRGKTFHLRPSFNECHGVAAFRDNVVVSGVKDDTICWCVVSLQDGRHDNLHKVCGGGLSWLTTKENMAYISCDANSIDDHGVYGFNLLNPSQPPYTYKPKGLSVPRGITVDDNGDLFVCDWCYSNSIHHLTEKCQLVDIYTEGIPRSPIAIFWDSGILYLASWLSNVITLYRTPHQGPAKTWMYRKDEKKGYRLVEDVAKLTIEDKKGKPQEIGSTLFGTTPATKATGFSFESAGVGSGFGTSGKLHRNVLNRCLRALLEDLDFKTVSVYIQEKELFDPVTMRDILEQKTTTEKIKELIERIQLRDRDTYDKFKKCLVQAKQEFLKDMLEKEETKLLQTKGKT